MKWSVVDMEFDKIVIHFENLEILEILESDIAYIELNNIKQSAVCRNKYCPPNEHNTVEYIQMLVKHPIGNMKKLQDFERIKKYRDIFAIEFCKETTVIRTLNVNWGENKICCDENIYSNNLQKVTKDNKGYLITIGRE